MRPLLLAALALTALRADTYPRQPGIDVQHYVFRINLSDQTDEIAGETTVSVRFAKEGVHELALDLAAAMAVTEVSVPYRRGADRLVLSVSATPGDIRSYTVKYRGKPAAGLKVLKNKYGERCFFSANWPDLAHQWLPTIDHPYDKATGEFLITAPSRYQVIANGALEEQIDLGDGRRLTHWNQKVPIATWLYNIGVAQFAVHRFGRAAGVPLETWVYPQDRIAGAATFDEAARRAVEFFSSHIGPYPYEKLAQVQAAGFGGGMEHASEIFYGERAVTGEPAYGLVAHETAHQWFGDSVTEKDWDDVWLSEGFATYFALLASEHYDGRDAFVAGLKRSRGVIFEAEKRMSGTSVVQNKPWKGIPNPIVYQKGAWSLHLLRNQVGNSSFWAGIRRYYREFRDQNVSSDDFRRVMEETSGQDLRWFFQQWLYRPGHPVLDGSWSYNATAKKVEIDLRQTQPGDPYHLPLEVLIGGRVQRIEMTDRQQHFELAADQAPATVTLDPNTAMLMEDQFAKRDTALNVWGAKSEIRTVEGAALLALDGRRSGDYYRARLTNRGKSPVHVNEVVLFRVEHNLAGESALYGESFQMLSQTGGTLDHPVNLGYDELAHYKIPQPPDAKVLTGMMTVTPPGGPTSLLGFTSAKRFSGRFYLRPKSIEVVLDTEGLAIAPGESWELEEFYFATGASRPALLAQLASRIDANHPPLKFARPPAGWCSWYCFGPRVTAQNVMDNLAAIEKDAPQLKYVQLDDGYQPAMGDWLETGNAFGGDVQKVLAEIRKQGFEPAIWVAPFIAEAGSHVFQQHPDWFMKDADGKPLSADKVTFRGWRRGPWYALDGTNPAVQKHLESVFRTMREKWGVTYFKLDANFWGAMHGGRLHDPKATRIEAYRRGMEAVLRGAGDSFILGCNHPVWASFGLIHGSRSSGDVSRKWETFEKIARQNLNRNWQNGTLWWNDPDAVTLSGSLPEEEYRFHASVAVASGGLILSGDDLTKLPEGRLAMLKKLLPPTGVAAEFEDESLRTGVARLKDRTLICLFNWGAAPEKRTVKLPKSGAVTDLWSGREYAPKQGTIEVELKGHEGTVLVIR